MQFYFSRTKPFRNLQRHIGSSTYRLNTVFVGLDCVAKGQGDAGSIAVTWKKPSADKSIQVANQAKIFACTSALMLGADIVDGYLREIVRQEWLKFDDETQAIATKATTGSGGTSYSFADRATAICNDLGLNEGLRIAGLDLLASWRNVVAHSGPRNVDLKKEIKALLLDSRAIIHQEYSHLDIELALKNFGKRQAPVGKEVTSLLAMASNLCRAIDQAAIMRVASTEEKMNGLVEQLLIEYFRIDEWRTVGPWQEISDAWQGSEERRRRNLEKILQKVGVATTPQPKDLKNPTRARLRRAPVSAPVSIDYLNELVSLNRYEFATRFRIEAKKSA